ncbi:hypothetical protein LOTGIDRAFT_134398 [Lottia gigantea]|uniref:Uncharacterized protein n=1 Tax=Lottia gigantea TaxID=225164 RepID=V3YWX5_LOTGI|nr:hypothetical protein LOTGIDRAFT_134398 [Lottia gigantea]ESO82558.1 hypothetical protein LOTGIDRAFT_134398 [Lottia gigantea]
MLCIKNKWPKVATIIIDKGCDIHHRNRLNQTALHPAAFDGHLELIKILVKKEADVNSQDCKGQSPFLISLLKQHDEIAVLLI